MDKKLTGLLGAVGALASINTAQADIFGPVRGIEGWFFCRPVRTDTGC